MKPKCVAGGLGRVFQLGAPEGFEMPRDSSPSPPPVVFKTTAIDHSAIPPRLLTHSRRVAWRGRLDRPGGRSDVNCAQIVPARCDPCCDPVVPSGNAPRGVAQVVLCNDVIAVKDRTCLVPSNLHGHALGNTSADHVSDRRTAEVVKEHLRTACLPAGHLPRTSEVNETTSFVMKNVVTVGRAPTPECTEHILCFTGHENDPTLFVLGGPWIKLNASTRPIHL